MEILRCCCHTVNDSGRHWENWQSPSEQLAIFSELPTYPELSQADFKVSDNIPCEIVYFFMDKKIRDTDCIFILFPHEFFFLLCDSIQ